MQANVTQRFPFSNRGLVQKLDVNQLAEDQYYSLINMISFQEGAIAPRYGYADNAITWGASVPSLIHSLASVTPSINSNPTIYVGEGTQIRRVTGNPASSTTIETSFDSVASKINIAQYKTDRTGESNMIYFATPGKMLRDDAYSQARVWGINPPFVSALYAPGVSTRDSILMSGSSGGINIGSSRISDTISVFFPYVVDSTGAGYYYIRPTGGSATIGAMIPGMGVLINSVLCRVEEVLPSTNDFAVYLSSAPSAGQTITAARSNDVSATGTITTSTSGSVSLDLSLTGEESTGYNSDDNIHVSFYVNTPNTIADIRLRFYVDGSTTDYYEKSILPSPAQPVEQSSSSVTDTVTAADVASEYSRAQDQNVYSQLDYTGYDFTNNTISERPYNNISSGLTPATLAPATSATWTELDIPKNQFLAVGQAGSGRKSWKYVTSFEYIVKPVNATAAYTVRYGGLYAFGGRGPNSAPGTTLSPYDYVYTYYDPTTGAESNPSPITKRSLHLRIAKQGIKVQCYGMPDTGEYAGITGIKIYRRGGAFADGLYRLVGTATNPGSGNKVYFDDTLDDLSIISRPVAQFDNNAPVLADLPNEYTGVVTNVAGTIGNGNPVTLTLTLSGGPLDVRTVLTVGTPFSIGGGVSGSSEFETCVVGGYGALSGEIITYCQNSNVLNNQISFSAAANIGCDLTLAALDRMWLAGNSYNPHVLYSSKTSRPESFPIINEASGYAHVITISSPDNPINGIAEYNGEIVCLCQNGIYTVSLDSGRLIGPRKTPANRGLYAKNAWCYVDNEIWFLAYDGIYSWGGGQVTKRSYAIDFIFNDRAINGIKPMARSASLAVPVISLYSMAQKAQEVYFNYMNTDGYFQVLRYHTLFDRWSIDEQYDALSVSTITRNGYNLGVTSITAMFIDLTSGFMYAARSTSRSVSTVADVCLYDWYLATNDGQGTPSSVAIYYQAQSKFFDLGMKMAKKQFTDLGVEITVGNDTNDFKIQLYYDYSTTPNVTDLFDLNPTAVGRQIYALPIQQTGSPSASAGFEARAVQYEIFGRGGFTDAWNGLDFTFIPMPDQIKGRVTDWDDVGHPWDKRFFGVTLEYDNNNTAVDLYLDMVFGLNSGSTALAVQTITLPAKSGRAKTFFPITADTVAKLVRLRPRVATVNYRIFDSKWDCVNYPADIVNNTDWSDYGYEFEKRFYQLYINVDTGGLPVPVEIQGDGGTVLQTVTVTGTGNNRMLPVPILKDIIATQVRLKVGAIPANAKFQLFEHKFDFERLPKPIVLSTPFSDFGYDYIKWAEQLAFDVNTNGTNVPVGVYGDGILKQTVIVNGTQANRNVNITLNPGITFQTMRLEVNPALIPSGGRFQLWDYRPIFRPADKGDVYHTFDWDDLNHPYDKKLKEVTIEFETQGLDVNIAVDTLTGIDGNVETLNAQTLTLNSAQRGFKTFPINDLICKMVRIRSLGTNSGGTHQPAFKMWGYRFSGTVNYPADKVVSTEWTDLGYKCDKIFRGVGIEVDTGGVDCTVTLQVDGNTVQSWTVNTNTNTRRVFLSAMNNTEINGKLYRLLFSAGPGGKSQLFGEPNYDVIKDSCEYVFWTSEDQAFGSVGFTVMKQNWLDYKCEGSVIVRFYNEDDVLFYSKTLPPHSARYPERFYLPSSFNGVSNKSRKHTITIEAADPNKPFKWYRDSSRIEIINLSSDQRVGYYQVITYSNMPLQV